MGNSKAIRLDQALQAWEDVCLMMEANYKQAQFENRLKAPNDFYEYAPEFRKFLINSFGQDFDPKFICEETDGSAAIDMVNSFPICIHSWINNSRRVYHLPSALQRMFLATSFKKIRFSDLRLPFSSFVITLDRPIEFPPFQKNDCLLIANINYYGVDTLATLLIDKDVQLNAIFSPEARERIRWGINRQHWDKITKVVKDKFGDQILSNKLAMPIVPILHKKEELSIGTIWEYQNRKEADVYKYKFKDFTSTVSSIFHILIGLCFYLQNLPPKIYQEATERKKPRQSGGGPKKLISDESEIFNISSESLLSREEQLVLDFIDKEEKSGAKVSPHFRTGYWRRPPGTGHNPGQMKTIWVKPTIVNAKLILEGIPKASKNILT
jgi:hypothetical protein